MKLPGPPSLVQTPVQAGAPATPNQYIAHSPSPPDTAPGGSHAGAYVLGSVGIAGLVVGGITGGMMLANKGVVDANCTDGAEGVKLCKTPAGVDAGNQAKTLGLVSTIGFGAGLAGLGAAAILLLTDSSSPKQPSQTSIRAPMQAAKPRWWLSAGPLSDAQGGAMLRVQGLW